MIERRPSAEVSGPIDPEAGKHIHEPMKNTREKMADVYKETTCSFMVVFRDLYRMYNLRNSAPCSLGAPEKSGYFLTTSLVLSDQLSHYLNA